MSYVQYTVKENFLRAVLSVANSYHTEGDSMSPLTQEEKATNADTMMHIARVREYLNICIKKLIDRAHNHDATKLASPEVELFMEHTHTLAGLTYGSPEYAECLTKLKPALDHHYANNRHHAEHFAEGINDMTLIDLLEMFCDWKAASERHQDGNIRKSIEINADRYGISPQLRKVVENTIEVLDK